MPFWRERGGGEKMDKRERERRKMKSVQDNMIE